MAFVGKYQYSGGAENRRRFMEATRLRAYADSAGIGRPFQANAAAVRAFVYSCGYSVTKFWAKQRSSRTSWVVEVADRETGEPRGFRAVRVTLSGWEISELPRARVLRLVRAAVRFNFDRKDEAK